MLSQVDLTFCCSGLSYANGPMHAVVGASYAAAECVVIGSLVV